MKIVLNIERNPSVYNNPVRVRQTRELHTVNEALRALWKLKKPRIATLVLVPETKEDRQIFGIEHGQVHVVKRCLFAKKNQRRGIWVEIVDTIEDTSELPALSERSLPAFWRQLPTKFNDLMVNLLKTIRGEAQDNQSGNAYDDIEVLIKPKPKKKAKKKAKSYKNPKPTIPPVILPDDDVDDNEDDMNHEDFWFEDV